MAKSSDEPFNPASHYNSATFSDVQVEFSGKVTKAHRIFLCSRSAYFQKALGPESKFMENGEGILVLHEDEPTAVEDMLRWIYTSEYPSAGKDSVGGCDSRSRTWEDHLNAMIVADKYGLPTLEKVAFDHCKAEVASQDKLAKEAGRATSDELIRSLIQRSWEYADNERRFNKLLASLPEISGARFTDLFEEAFFREWIDTNPDVAKPLIEKWFVSLMRKKSFRDKISQDPELSLQQLDRLLQEQYKSYPY